MIQRRWWHQGLNRWVLSCRLKVSTVRQDLTSDGSEFQVCGATTDKDRRSSRSGCDMPSFPNYAVLALLGVIL